MKTPRDTPAAELFAELVEHRDFLSQLESDHAVTPISGDAREIAFQKSQMSVIAAELDRRCEDAGIVPQGTSIEFHRITSWQFDYLEMKNIVAVNVSVSPHELRDLLTWLLMKEDKTVAR